MQPILRRPAIAVPPLRVTQREAYEFFASHFTLAPDEEALYRRLLLEPGPVQGRHLGMDRVEEAAETDPDRLNARFLKHARRTAADAARVALSDAGLTAADLGGLVVNTCTGYLCPGLSSYLSEDLRCPPSTKAIDLAGMGCGGSIPNLDCAAALLAAGDGRPWLSVAVEICSATLFMGADPALVVSNSIFGDGAAAVVLQDGATLHDSTGTMRILGRTACLRPEYREQLRYRLEGGRLRNVLSIRVPSIGARVAAEALEALLGTHQLTRDSIRWWAIHAGGTAVLDQVGRDLGLSAESVQYSLDVFRDYGNMSSPSVLFALRNVIDRGKPRPGDLGVLLSFGAGFAAYAMLVEFQ
jgi:alkylresorcinol/alkylpyrone synthase